MRALRATLIAWIGACAAAGAPAAPGVGPAEGAEPASGAGIAYPAVVPGRILVFPADLGSHPHFRTEWWYVTGWLQTETHRPLGFQVTFFRTRPNIESGNPSAFAPGQLLIAHCALSDPSLGRLEHDQRIRRAGLSLAEAAENDTHVWIDDWSLEHRDRSYRAQIAAEDFTLALEMRETQPPMANGAGGFSRKGPGGSSASYYYSVPHLAVSGSVGRGPSVQKVRGEAWLDHEWASEYLDPEAAGWDWIGVNLDDGGALMAFRIRGLDGAERWAGGTLRDARGRTETFGLGEIRLAPGRPWVSRLSGTSYPVQWRVHLPRRDLDLKPLMDDQENDARLSTGMLYWEGAVEAYEHDRPIGRGYLELTGYAKRVVLR